MPVTVDSSKISKSRDPEERASLQNAALDSIWERSWMKSVISREETDRIVEALEEAAAGMRADSSRIVIVCDGIFHAMVRAMRDALAEERAREQLILTGDTLSAKDLSQVIRRISGRDVSLIVLAEGEESVSLLAAYTCIKKMIVERAGKKKSGRRITMILGDGADYLRKEAQDEGLELISLPDGVTSDCAAGTAAMILPILLAGKNAEDYMTGFRTMAADPWWDRDAADYGLDYREALKSAGSRPLREAVLFSQSELAGTASYIAALHRRIGAAAGPYRIPADVPDRGTDYETHLFTLEEAEDIVLPLFPGGNLEGSLNGEAKTASEKLFERMGGPRRIAVRTDSLEEEEFGRLMAYLQMSSEISAFDK